MRKAQERILPTTVTMMRNTSKDPEMAKTLPGHLELDFLISVSAHLVPGQTWEGDVLLREAQDRDVVDPVVLDLRSAIRKTLHLHLGADLSRQDAW